MFKYFCIAVLACALFICPEAARADDTDLQQLRQDARTGSSTAQYLLGMKYLEGDGVAQDPAAASQWLTEAASRGHEEALKMLSDIPFHETNDINLLQRLANGGNPDAQMRLGEIYYKGEGVAQDLVAAYMWFALAAMQLPSGEAKNNAIIARVRVSASLTEEQLFEGKKRVGAWRKSSDQPISVTPVQAAYNDDFQKYQNAAQRGDAAAQLALAKMYFNGIGIEQDLIEGYKWIHLSLMPPGLSGKERRKALILQGKWQYRMSMEDIRAAEQRAVDWHKGIR